MENFNIFEMMYESFKFKNDKPIRLIEFFAGYGSQALGLKYLKINFEHYKICEWAIPSIIAYANLHQNELEYYGQDFCGDLTKEQIADLLFQYGVSDDYNSPCTLEKLKKMPEEKLRLVFNSIQWTNNLVDISRVKGYELGIEREREYILTYSFPCQDLSLAGKGLGMKEGSGTRSSLLFEVERILSECEYKPQVLIMENVTQVHGANNINFFKDFILRLEKLGYESYWNDMSATHYAIPQTRNRTFMVSILNGKNGEKYNYTFPKKIPLKLRLKDLLESNVDEKYYISNKMIDYISATGTKNFSNNDSKINREIARPLTTDPNKRAGTTNYIGDNLPDDYDLSKIHGTQNRAELLLLLLSKNGEIEKHDLPNGCDSSLNNPKIRDISNTITTRYDAGIQNQQQIGMCVVEKEIVGTYDFAQSDTFRSKEQRIHIGKEVSGTIISSGNRNGIVIKENDSKENLGYTEKSLNKIKTNIVDENDVSGSLTATGMQSLNHDGCQLVSLKRGYSIEVKEEKCETNKVDYIGNYSKSNFNQTSIVGKNGIAPTVTENHGQVTSICESELLGGIGEKDSNGGTQWKFQNRVYNSENSSPSVTTAFNPNYKTGLRIRKLTPKECFRLQGLKDEDIDKVMIQQSNSSGYHLAGDSICVTCLMALYSTLFDKEWDHYINPKRWWRNE